MHYIKYGVKERRNPSKEFDTSFYLRTYPDVRESKMNPLVHYILYGGKEGRFNYNSNPKINVLEQTKINLNTYTRIEILQLIDGINICDNDKELLINFINGNLNKLNIKNFFSSDDYSEMYPDIKVGGINPLLHYLLHGRREGRLPFVDIKQHILEGNRLFDSSKETIMLVSHESSASGAPLLGLNIGKKIADRYNLIHYVMKKSNIHNVFFEDCFLLIEEFDEKNSLIAQKAINEINKQYNLKCVVCNSIVTYPILQIASDLKISTLSLIHEFSEYTKPKTKMLNNIIASDRVVLPAKIIETSVMEQLKEIAGLSNTPSNISIYVQFHHVMVA
jgi:hypothetical protein